VNLTVLNKANFVDFEFKVNSCIDSFVLEIAEVITEPIGNIDGILWELEGEIESMTSTEFKPTFVLKNSQFIDLKVSINTNTDCPSSFSKSFRISILEDIQLMDSLLICQGETVKLNSNPTTQNLDYEWSPTTDLNDAFIANPLANPSVTTRYQLTYSDTNKLCQMDRFVTVVVRDTMPKLEASYVVDCDARKVIFTPNSDALINWDFGDGSPIMQSSEGNSFQHIYETAGTYSVRLTFAAAHICPDQAIINIELPQNNIRPNFEWNVESCENNQASLELIDLTKAVYGKVTQWEWQLSNGEMANEEESVFLIDQSIPLTATLRITVDNNENCSDSITMEIPALLIEESILDSLIACKGDRVELNPDYNPSYTYEWTPSAHLSNPIEPNPTIELQAAQTFIVSMENEFECTLQDTIFTDVAPDIEVDILEVPTICSDMEIVLLAESEQAIKQWWLNEEGDTLGFEPELLINIDKERQLSVGFIDAFNCQKKELLNVDYQAIKLEYDQRQLACSTGDYQINLENLNPSIPLSFEWQPVAAIIDGANTANPLVRPSQDSQFIFVAKNDFGCEWIDTITVIQKAAPDLEVSATKDTIFDSETTQLMATQNPTYLYDWMPATSLNSATVYNPVASPKTSTVYTLTVTDDMGCTNTASIPITVRRGVCDFPYIFVPSGFTPNGDGENDVLYVRGTFITSLTFIIYDRWGDKVFESKNQDIGWDGKRNGKALSAGVYGYYLEAICLDGQRYLKQGNVTLIR
jgi:gliding motility-associated-like protein